MKLEKVYDKEGDCLGDKYVNLDGLMLHTQKAINQLFHLEEQIMIYEEAFAKMSQPEQVG